MAQMMKIDLSIQNQLRLMQAAPKEIRLGMKRELVAIAKESVMEARSKMPSGMAKGSAGYRWRYWGGKGAVIEALGNNDASAPRSYAAASEGGRSGTRGWRHPVYPSAGEDRKKWYWAGAHGGRRQKPTAALHLAWAERRVTIVRRSEEVVKLAMERAGFMSEGL